MEGHWASPWKGFLKEVNPTMNFEGLTEMQGWHSKYSSVWLKWSPHTELFCQYMGIASVANASKLMPKQAWPLQWAELGDWAAATVCLGVVYPRP